MPFDAAFYIETGLLSAILTVSALLLLGIRAFARVLRDIPALIGSFTKQLLWVDEEIEAEDGTKKLVRKPSPQLVEGLQAILPVVAPVLVAEGAKWAKANIKLGGGSPIGGLGGSPADLSGLIASMLPKKYQALAGLAMPFLGKLIPGLGGSATPEAGATGTNPYANAYKR